jgi:hypothetical protein
MQKIFTLLLAGMCLYCHAQQNTNTVNLVIGDESFVTTFGIAPDENISERFRIQTHLWYVEGHLRMKDISYLNEEQQRKRALVLDMLHTYWVNGNFPSNYDHPNERRPCFIDRDGNICAVGYLVEQTAGAETAQDINAKHQYDYIEDMYEDVLVAWATEYGLTLEECAMIQPAYNWNPTPVNTVADKGITKGYGISSAIVSGSNLALSMYGLSSFRSNSKVMPYLGLITGAGGIVLGVMNIKKDNTLYYISGESTTESYKSRNNLSYLNIAMGTASVVSSTLNLLLNRKERRTVLNVYSSPGIDNSINMGFTLTKKI